MATRARTFLKLTVLGASGVVCAPVGGQAVANGPTALPAEPTVLEQAGSPADAAPERALAEDNAGDERAARASTKQQTPILGAHSRALEASPIGAATDRPSTGWGVMRTLGGLGIVIALVLALRWAIKWLAGRAPSLGAQLTAAGRSPSGVLEVLGRYPVARGQKLVLLRLDRRVLLLNQTSEGFATLAELTDPEDVASILSKVRDEEGESLASRFNATLRSMERDPSIGPEAEVIEVDETELHPRSPRLAMQRDEHAASMIEPKPAPPTGSASLADRLRAMRERWA